MTTIAAASVTSTAPADAFFACWADMATWPEWNLDTDWVTLDGEFATGATGTLKPKGGPKVHFEVTVLSDTEFVDVSKLLGARLTFRHTVTRGARTRVDVEVSITGPLAFAWRRILGSGIAASAQPDLERLARRAAELSCH